MTDHSSRKIILHAGAYKTATTTVQTILARSSPYLLTQGVLYPQTGRRLNTGSSNPHSQAHHPFYHAACNQDGPPAKNQKLQQALAKEIAASRAQNVVLSTELITFASLREKRALLNMIAPDQENVSVVYALRRPDDYLDSMLNQSLKNGRLDRVRAWRQKMEEGTYNVRFLQDILDWQKILGPDRLQVVYFCKTAYQHYLEKLFLHLGVTLSDPRIDTRVHDNSAVTQLGYVLRKICFARLAELDHVPTRLDRHHISIHLDGLEQSLGLASRKMIMLSSEDRVRVLESQAAEIAEVAGFLDEEDRALLRRDMEQGVPAGVTADDPDAAVSLPGHALSGIIASFSQGHLRNLLRYGAADTSATLSL